MCSLQPSYHCFNGRGVVLFQPSYRPVIEELDDEEEDDSEDEPLKTEDEPVCAPHLIKNVAKLTSNEGKSSRILIEEIHSDDVVACGETALGGDNEKASDGGRRHVWGPETQVASATEANIDKTKEIGAGDVKCARSCGDGENIEGDRMSMDKTSKSVGCCTERQPSDDDLEGLD